MAKETFAYDELNVGAYEAMSVDIAEGQTIKRGDLLLLKRTQREQQQEKLIE